MADASEQLRVLGARMKAAGATGMKLELTRTLRQQAGAAIPAVRDSARQSLPKAGGLADRIADTSIKVSVRTAGRTAGVRIVARKHDAVTTNGGTVRHPVFGHRDRWVTQAIPDARGWWERGFRDNGVEISGALAATVRTYMRRIGGV